MQPTWAQIVANGTVRKTIADPTLNLSSNITSEGNIDRGQVHEVHTDMLSTTLQELSQSLVYKGNPHYLDCMNSSPRTTSEQETITPSMLHEHEHGVIVPGAHNQEMEVLPLPPSISEPLFEEPSAPHAPPDTVAVPEPPLGLWCLHENCLESTEQFLTEAELIKHTTEVHISGELECVQHTIHKAAHMPPSNLARENVVQGSS